MSIPDPVLTLSRGRQLPCSHLVAAWVLALLGREPDDPSTPGAWRAMDPDLWAAVNIEDHRHPWSGPLAVSAETGAETLVGTSASYEPLPALEPGGLYMVQRWRDADSLTDGHAYMVEVRDGGYWLHDSTVTRGLRSASTRRWVAPGFRWMAVRVA